MSWHGCCSDDSEEYFGEWVDFVSERIDHVGAPVRDVRLAGS